MRNDVAGGASSKPEKLAVFFPSGRLETTPTFKHLISTLARAFSLDVFAVKNIHAPHPEVLDPGVQVHIYPQTQAQRRESVPSLTFGFWRWFRHFDRQHYVGFVAGGIRGLFVASAIRMFNRKPIIYHSLELYPSSAFNSGLWKVYKSLERWCTRMASLIIVQDPMRANQLAQDNGIEFSKFAYFPVSTFGPAVIRRSEFLRRRFGIAPSQKIILCAGTIYSELIPAQEIVAAAQSWPANWTLVLHSSEANLSASETATVRRADWRRRTIFSNDPVSYKDLPDLIASADIGLALYNDYNENIRLMGLSSGKISEYTACGIPIVVSDLPGIGNLVEQYRCGRTIASINELTVAVQEILNDQVGFSRRAVEFFNNELDLNNYSQDILDRVASVVRRRQTFDT